jgi:hypothetical protein
VLVRLLLTLYVERDNLSIVITKYIDCPGGPIFTLYVLVNGLSNLFDELISGKL